MPKSERNGGVENEKLWCKTTGKSAQMDKTECYLNIGIILFSSIIFSCTNCFSQQMMYKLTMCGSFSGRRWYIIYS